METPSTTCTRRSADKEGLTVNFKDFLIELNEEWNILYYKFVLKWRNFIIVQHSYDNS